MPSVLLAAVEEPDRLGSMALYFVVAVAIVGPYGVVRVRRVLRDRAERGAPGIPWRGEGATGGPPSTDLSPAPAPDPGELARAIDAIEAGARTEAAFEVSIPARPRLNGAPADPATVEALLADALRRSGVVVVTDDVTALGRVLTCRRA